MMTVVRLGGARRALLGLVLAAGCVCGAETLYPVYTVTADPGAGETNFLAQCDVEVVASEGADPVTNAFSALDKSAGNFSGTFVMRPAKYLRGSPDMASFTGVVRIETGAYVYTGAGCLGPQNKSTAPEVWVSSGASLVNAAQLAKPDGCLHNKIHIAGEGYEGIGAYASALKTAHSDYCFYAPWYLEDDAHFGFLTSARVDFGGSDPRYFYLQNHTLTIRGITTSGKSACFCIYSAPVVAGGTSGKIVVDDDIEFLPQSGSVWTGDANNELVITNGAKFRYYNAANNIPFTLVYNSKGGMSFGHSAGTEYDWGTTNRNFYAGPVRIDSNVLTVRGGANPNTAFSFWSPITGVGGMYVANLICSYCSGGNTFAGPAAFNRANAEASSGAVFHSPAAVPSATPRIVFTNSFCRLADRADLIGTLPWKLPPCEFHVSAGESQEIEVYSTGKTSNGKFANGPLQGGAEGTLASLKKTGAGELHICPALAITGVTEIAEGTLRLSPVGLSAVPGLWEGSYPSTAAERAEWAANYTGVKNVPAYNWYTAAVPLTNCVRNCVYFGTVRGFPWTNFDAKSYHGYLWNRESTTNETWTFVGSVYDACQLYINGKQLIYLYDSANLGCATATIKPGPNEIKFMMWACTGGASSGGGMKPFNNWPNWIDGMGFAFRRANDRAAEKDDKTLSWQDFIAPTNGPAGVPGGDGYWFTRDTRDTGDFTVEELSATRSSISNLVLHAAGTLDAAGSPVFVETLAGLGTVTNGGLVVKGAWQVPAADLAAGGTLKVDGELAFTAASPTVSFPDLSTLNRAAAGATFTLVEAKGGITGTPVYASDSEWPGAKNWHLAGEQTAAGTRLTFYYRAGTSLIFR